MPEVLAAYFRERAAEQEHAREVEGTTEPLAAAAYPPVPAPPPAKTEQPPSLADVWQNTLAGLRVRLPRDMYQTCVRQATLMSYADGVITIGVSDARLKDGLQHAPVCPLQLAIADSGGEGVSVRIRLNIPF